MIKTAIVGLGTISPIHKYAIEANENARLVCVCDIDESKKAGYEQVNFYTGIDEMLASEEIDCVHICLPHFLHAPVIKKCAEKGINVFSEKPITLNYEEAQELFGLEAKHNIKIGVCMQNRYNKTSIAMREIAKSGEYGKFLGSKGIVTWARNMSYYNEAAWRGLMALAGGGVMINQSIHTLDLLSFIGGEFESLEAKTANFSLKETEIEDSVMSYLKYKNSDATSIYFATIAYCENSSVEIELAFEKAIFKMSNSKLYKYLRTGEIELICEDEKLISSKHYYGMGHQNTIKAFHDAIMNDTNDYVSLKQAAYAVKLIDSIRKSNEENKEIIID